MPHYVEPPRTRVEQVDQFLDIEVEEVDGMAGRRRMRKQVHERAICACPSSRIDVDRRERLAVRLEHSQRISGGHAKPHRPGDVTDHVHARETWMGRIHAGFVMVYGVSTSGKMAESA